jgi:hypothetical protein
MSHEIGSTEIERYFNCHSIRSDLLSLRRRSATKKIFRVDVLDLASVVGENWSRSMA